jgi:hypothetical protein
MQTRKRPPVESVRRQTELRAPETLTAIHSPSEHFYQSSLNSAILPDLERCPQFEFDEIHQKEHCSVSTLESDSTMI